MTYWCRRWRLLAIVRVSSLCTFLILFFERQWSWPFLCVHLKLDWCSLWFLHLHLQTMILLGENSRFCEWNLSKCTVAGTYFHSARAWHHEPACRRPVWISSSSIISVESESVQGRACHQWWITITVSFLTLDAVLFFHCFVVCKNRLHVCVRFVISSGCVCAVISLAQPVVVC